MNYLNQKTAWISFIFAALFILGCKSKPEIKEEPKNTVLSGLTLSGYFNALYCKADTFARLQDFPDGPPFERKMMGNLYLKSCIEGDGFTLHGWTFKKGGLGGPQFYEDPNVKLDLGYKTSIQFGVGSYIGDFILYKNDLRTIQRAIKAHSELPYIVFIPNKVDGRLVFSISLSKDPATANFVNGDRSDDFPVGVLFNPIPPGGLF